MPDPCQITPQRCPVVVLDALVVIVATSELAADAELVITAPDSDWLVEFTRRLVTDRLAGSVHHIADIRSICTAALSWISRHASR